MSMMYPESLFGIIYAPCRIIWHYLEDLLIWNIHEETKICLFGISYLTKCIIFPRQTRRRGITQIIFCGPFKIPNLINKKLYRSYISVANNSMICAQGDATTFFNCGTEYTYQLPPLEPVSRISFYPYYQVLFHGNHFHLSIQHLGLF